MDLLQAHVVENPDQESERLLLETIAPSADRALLAKLVAAFDELRALADAGALSYPYSTRELCRVARASVQVSIEEFYERVFESGCRLVSG